MSIYNRKTAMRNFIIALVLCIALVAGIVAVALNKHFSTNSLFGDQLFAQAIASSLGCHACDIDQSMLDKFESLVYYCDIGMSDDYKTANAYPVVILGYKDYTDKIISGDTEDYDPKEGTDYIAAICVLQDVNDLALFSNLRYLSAFDASNIYQMSYNAYISSLYAQIYGSSSSVSFDDVVKNMKLTGIKTLDVIKNLTKLEVLALEYSDLTSLEGIDAFENLTSLDIVNTSISSLEGIENSTKLETLMMGGLGISDLSALSSLTSLKTLDTSSNDIEDLTTVSSLTSLEKLSLSSNKLTSLDGLQNLTNLTTLDVSGNEDLADISAVSAAVELESLYIYGTKVTTLDALSGMTKLEALNASECEITDISALKNCTALTELNISENKITDISAIASCTKLTTLDACCNEIADISAIKSLTEATSIDLSDNKIVDIVDAVTGLNKLTTLNLSDNEITDLTGLEKCWTVDDFKATVTLTDNKLESITFENSDGEETKYSDYYKNASFTGLKVYTSESDTSDTSDTSNTSNTASK